MNAIAAVVLGGTSLMGGRGSIGGSLIGAFVIGVLADGLVMMGVSEFWQIVIKGVVIRGGGDRRSNAVEAAGASDAGVAAAKGNGGTVRPALSRELRLCLTADAGLGATRRDTRPLMAIIVPSQDNPYFKAEADAAASTSYGVGVSRAGGCT